MSVLSKPICGEGCSVELDRGQVLRLCTQLKRVKKTTKQKTVVFPLVVCCWVKLTNCLLCVLVKFSRTRGKLTAVLGKSDMMK